MPLEASISFSMHSDHLRADLLTQLCRAKKKEKPQKALEDVKEPKSPEHTKNMELTEQIPLEEETNQ